MKPLAVFTISRNESVFLPLWVSHYGKLGEDLFVLDHESDDGSTDIPGITRRIVHRQTTDDVGWMLRTVTAFQHELLREYAVVIFSEVDEFLVPQDTATATGYDIYQRSTDESLPTMRVQPLSSCNLVPHLESHHSLASYLAAWTMTPQDTATATGYDICQRSTDGPLDPSKTFMDQRGWKRNPRYDKTLVSISPLEWEVGFHRLKGVREGADNHYPDPALMLIHLHYMDREIAWSRLVSRMSGREPEPGSWGIQNKIKDRAEFDKLFDAEVAGAVDIPQELRGLL